MKALLLAVAVLLFAAPSRAYDGPYAQFWTTAENISSPLTSAGATIESSGHVRNGLFSQVAVVYHAADPNNSLIPATWQGVVPAEAWACSLGYGGTDAGLGCSVNLGAQVQGYASEGLLAIQKPWAQAVGAAIKPGASPLALAVGPEWETQVISGSTLLPFKQWKGSITAFVGLSWKIGAKATGSR